jgi:dihydrofolate reductase
MINMIFAADEKGAIGYKGGLPWPSMPGDIERYLGFTRNATIVFGRGTYETADTLSGKRKILLTTSVMEAPDVKVVHDVSDIVKISKDETVWVIGGSKMFESVLPFADKIYMTLIHGVFTADTYFTFDTQGWKLIEKAWHDKDDKNPYAYEFLTYERA